MFVGASVHVEHSIRACGLALAGSPDTWFPRVVDSVEESSEKHLTSVGFKVAGIPVRKQVQVTLGEPVSEGDWLRIPLSWTPTFPANLFPSLDGKLELFPLDPSSTRLTVSGTYTPPLDALGQNLDEVVMHSVAEATLKDLVQAIADEHLVHLFGSGHSVIPVLDVFPRYGSFPGFHPLLDPRLMWSNVLGPGGG